MQPAHLQDDLKQEMFTAICKLDNEKLMVLAESKQLHRFASGIMMRMITRPRTTFYNTHRKYREELLSGGVHLTTEGTICQNELRDDTAEWMQTVFYNIPDELVDEEADEADHWANKVEAAMAALDPYEAGLFKLYMEQGESCAPVAQLTDISERSVRFAVSQAREKMKKHLTS